MELTVNAVNEIMTNCLYNEGEETEGAKVVEGVISNYGFHPDRLKIHKAKIAELLAELPIQFQSAPEGGGGWSFLNACMTKDDIHWGEHRDIEHLLVLGIATEQAKYTMPRSMWSILPGSLPYFSVS